MMIAGLPLAYPAFRTSTVPSVTCAMSLSRTGAPSLIGHDQRPVLIGLQVVDPKSEIIQRFP